MATEMEEYKEKKNLISWTLSLKLIIILTLINLIKCN